MEEQTKNKEKKGVIALRVMAFGNGIQREREKRDECGI